MNLNELHSIRPSNWDILSREGKEMAESVTSGSNWSADQFKVAMLALSALRVPVPSYNRPESFGLGRLASFADDIQRRTVLNGREHARLIIADWEAQKLLAHKNIHVGDENSATLSLTKQTGRERYQSIVGVLHTHPVPDFPSFRRQNLHLSGEDFRVLLTNEEMLFMLARYDGENLIALKTTATPNYSMNRFDKVLRDLEYEFIDNSHHGSFTEQTVKFTKYVCLETGLTLYRTPPGSATAKREPVTV